MISALSEWMYALIGLGLVSALAESVIPNNNHKQILRLITAVCMATMLLSVFLKAGYYDYAAALRSQKLGMAWDTDETEKKNQAMNRTLIESQCSAYIEDKAAVLGVSIVRADVSVCWDSRGFWVPDHVVLTLPREGSVDNALSDIITTDLGISREEQEWRTDE